MKLYYADEFVLPLPAGHRFPIEKYRLLREALQSQDAFQASDFCVPQPANDGQILRAHDSAYLERIVSGRLDAAGIRRIGFPWSAQMVERSRRSAGASIAACRSALADGVAASLAGGTHHAHRDFGSGFCVFNDVAIAARAMQAEAGIGHIAIIDCDVHQGDGTATIFADDPSVFTFSIHGAKNFPFRKQCSDLDIELADGCGDAEYLQHLDLALAEVFDRVRPELVIYLAGADPFKGDRLGRLGLSMEGLLERDRRILQRCREHGAAIALTMAGGYADPIEDTVRIHAGTVLLARQFAR